MRILLDENFLHQAERIRRMGHEVVSYRINAGKSDRVLALEAASRGAVIVTRDRDFVRLWKSLSSRRAFSAVVIQGGPANTLWPSLLEQALAWVAANGGKPGLVEIKRNRLKAIRATGT